MADQAEQVIFAELRRSEFDRIVVIARDHFGRAQWGSQGDDWLWIELAPGRLVLDSFYSRELELKGPRACWNAARELLGLLPGSLILQRFEPPRCDLTC